MSEPTRLKAIAAGAFLGAPLTILGGIGGLMFAAQDLSGGALSAAIGALAGLISGLISFASSRRFPISYAFPALFLAGSAAGLMASSSGAFSLRVLD